MDATVHDDVTNEKGTPQTADSNTAPDDRSSTSEFAQSDIPVTPQTGKGTLDLFVSFLN